MRPADRFDLARGVSRVLERDFQGYESVALLRTFGVSIEEEEETYLDALLKADGPTLSALAEYTGLVEPDATAAEDDGHGTHLTDEYRELVSAETALRDVVRLAVPSWRDLYSAEDLARLQAKVDEEDKRRDGIHVSTDLLDYTEIHQLTHLVLSNWNNGVQRILDDKKRTETYLGIIKDVRNSIGHSRPVYQSERYLLAGAAGQIRNQLAVYRASVEGPEAHYPSIDSARDSFGWTSDTRDHTLNYFSRPDKVPRINVGDLLIFDLEATDPRGRPLIWKGFVVEKARAAFSIAGQKPFIELQGARVQAQWTVTDAAVGESRLVVFTVMHSGRFHREGNWDDGRVFQYHVNPPID